MKWRVEGLLPFAGACGGRGFFYIYSVLMNGLTGRFLFVPFLVTCDSTCQGGLPTPKFGRVTTATTFDIDPQCRKVLKSLPEVWSGVVMWLWESWTWRLDTGDSRLYWSHSCSQAIYFIRPKRPDWTKSTLFSDFVHAGPGLALQFKIEDFFNFIYLHWHWLTDSHVFQVRQSDLQCISASMARQDCRPQCVQGSLMDRITPNARSCPQASDLVLEIMGHEFRSWHHMCTMTLYHYSNYMWTMWVPVLLVQHFTVMLFFILFAKGRTWTNQRWCKIRNGQPAWRGGPGKSIWVFNRQSDRVLVWQLQRLQGFWHFGWVIDSKSQLSCQGQCLTVLT